MEEPRLHCIGILHGDITRLADAPKNFSESKRTGTLEIYPQYRDGLDGITVGQTLVVLFWLHKADRNILRVHPRGDRSRRLRGVFATRSPARPNPIALSELLVQAIDDNKIEVSGVDVLDATPIIDMKKKI
jgi:L-fuculose-phosphate aldolase